MELNIDFIDKLYQGINKKCKKYKINLICNILKKLSGKKNPIIADKTKLRKNDTKNVVSDCSKIKKLGWKPKISISKGLELTLNWYIAKN